MGGSKVGTRFAALVMTVGAAVLAGCGSTVSQMPVIGMPANAPPPPAQTKGYLPVNDTPAARDQAPLNAGEQVSMEQQLSTIRARQKAAAAADAAAIAASPAPVLPSQSRSNTTAR